MTDDLALEATALGEMFALDARDEGLLAEQLAACAAERGLQADRLIRGLAAGRSIGAALGVSPALGEALYAKAYRWCEVGRLDRALPLFRALCIVDGTVADYWAGYGLCLRTVDQPDLAELAFGMAAALRPDWALPFFHLAAVAATTGRDAESAALLDAFDARVGKLSDDPLKVEASRLRLVLASRREGGGGG